MSSNYFRENPPTSYPGTRWYRLPKTTDPVSLRFLPAMVGASQPGKMVYYHYNVLDHPKIHCFRTYDIECPLCLLIDDIHIRKQFNGIINFTAQIYSYFNVLILSDSSKATQCNSTLPHLLGVNGTDLFYWVSNFSKPNSLDITDPFNGHTVLFQRPYRRGPFQKTIKGLHQLGKTQDAVQEVLRRCYNFNIVWPDPTEFDKHRMEGVCRHIRRRYRCNT